MFFIIDFIYSKLTKLCFIVTNLLLNLIEINITIIVFTIRFPNVKQTIIGPTKRKYRGSIKPCDKLEGFPFLLYISINAEIRITALNNASINTFMIYRSNSAYLNIDFPFTKV